MVVVIAEDINLEQCAQCDTRTLNRFVIEVEVNNGELPPDNVVQLVHCICNSCYAEWVE